MTNKQIKRGFTLIELLVVVLIIGVLTSVALPQYRKAVRKAQLAEVASTASTFFKAIDLYVLEKDGYPQGKLVYFTGSNKDHKLDFDLECSMETTSNGAGLCITPVGGWFAWCFSGGCQIVFSSCWNTDGTCTNNWLDSAQVRWSRRGQGRWGMYLDPARSGTAETKRTLCEWWRDLYGLSGFATENEFHSKCF